MWIIILTLALVSQVLAPSISSAQVDSSAPVYAPILRTQRVGAGVVRIVYDLNGAVGSRFTVSLEASDDGGQTFAIRPAATSGDIGANIVSGAGKAIDWDTTKDVDDLQLDRSLRSHPLQRRPHLRPTARPSPVRFKSLRRVRV